MTEKNFFIDDQNATKYIDGIGEFINSKVTDANREGVVLGMSGGIDCSVVARLCQEGGVKSKLVMLPDSDGMQRADSMKDAMELINRFGFDHMTVSIKDACEAIEKSIQTATGNPLGDLSSSNIRPRVRMATLYSIAQDLRSFVIGTGNYNERKLGYFTKWGDGAYDLNPLGLITKGEIRTLAKHLNVPENIITKSPSAGLFDGQTDEEEMGFSYAESDKYLLTGTSGNKDADQKIAARIAMSGHKLIAPPIFTGLNGKERVK